jgi:hypothetical protein
VNVVALDCFEELLVSKCGIVCVASVSNAAVRLFSDQAGRAIFRVCIAWIPCPQSCPLKVNGVVGRRRRRQLMKSPFHPFRPSSNGLEFHPNLSVADMKHSAKFGPHMCLHRLTCCDFTVETASITCVQCRWNAFDKTSVLGVSAKVRVFVVV